MAWWKPKATAPLRVTNQAPPNRKSKPPKIVKPPKSGKGDGKGR